MADAEESHLEPAVAPEAETTNPTARQTDTAASEVSPETRLEELKAQATSKYAVKDYKAAAELYSRATELQAEINGEMSPKNANLLYYYGRCLYHVAVSNSDVLGAKVAGEDKETSSKKLKPTAAAEPSKAGESSLDAKAATASSSTSKQEEPHDPSASKPFFQFQGDENFEVSDEEDEDGEEDAAAPAADDDFSDAFEVLDMARVLLRRQLDEYNEIAEPDEATQKETRAVKERLADTYDLQAEISLENENFPQAAIDTESSLQLKTEVYPFDSALIAEAHYKLSLALEFSSISQPKDANGQPIEGEPYISDAKKREESAMQMEKAIESCKARIKIEEAKVEAATDETEAKKLREQVTDVKQMTDEMKLRLIDLHKPLVSVNEMVVDPKDALKGILGSIQGETSEAKKAVLEAAAAKANDLTGLVKRKRKDEDAGGAESASDGKRAKTEEQDGL